MTAPPPIQNKMREAPFSASIGHCCAELRASPGSTHSSRAAADRMAAAVSRVPAEPPKFTVATLRSAIPAHCWERSVFWSFFYLLRDLAMMAALTVASTHIDAAPVPTWAKWTVLWPLYWWLQGNIAWGVWVIGHECGHGAFSAYPWLNDTVGLVLHSVLMAPYFSWKHSHRRHHSNCNSLAKDEAFVPNTRPEPSERFEFGQLAIVRIAKIVLSLTVGWPLYLFFNLSGRNYDGKYVNHFDPYAPIFNKSERLGVGVTDAALVAVCYGLTLLAKSFGWAWVVKVYAGPIAVCYFWLVTVTLLHHCHPSLPRYADGEWDWLRGALGTVDRNYGLLTHLHHRIGDTHVLHHLFSSIPHYHAPEATEAIKKVIGPYYLWDDRSILVALWDDWKNTRYVAPDTPGSGVMWFRK